MDDLSLAPPSPRADERTDADRAELSWIEQRARGVARGDLDGALNLAATLVLPFPGQGRTRQLWEGLAVLGAVDLQLARAAEPHLDACAILDQAGVESPAWGRLGVFAAEGGSERLLATAAAADDAGTWRLSGVKPWCSLADRLSHALVTAWVDDRRRGLFLVSLRGPSVTCSDGPWLAHGLPDVVSAAVTFDDAEAVAVGEPQWYLERPGFWWGGIGVAAIWYGGLVGLARTLHAAAGRRAPDQVALLHLGAVDVAVHAARTALVEAARLVDSGRAVGREGALAALRTRQVVADAAEAALAHLDHALGPAPLVADAEHAARVSDLRLYLRQHHAERDLASLGARLLEEEA